MSVLLAMLGLAACGQVGQVNLPRPAPPLSGPGLSGERDRLALADFDDQVVLVAAWSSWCAPCREEVPVLRRAQRQLGDEGLQVLGLNVKDEPGAARQFAQQHGADYPSIVDRDGELAVSWGLRALPESFLIDREGRIVAQRFGAVDQEWIETVVVPEVTG